MAVGTLDPVVDIWDLDMVGSLEPAFSLGKKKRKKVKKRMKQKQGNASNEVSIFSLGALRFHLTMTNVFVRGGRSTHTFIAWISRV